MANEKEMIWEDYRERKHKRVPVIFGTNPRAIILDRKFNKKGISFYEYSNSPELMINIQLQHLEWRRTYLSQFADINSDLPEKWTVYIDLQNYYDSAYFGAELVFREDQVPDVVPYLREDENKHKIFDVNIEEPLENPFVKKCCDFWEKMKKIVDKMEYQGRLVELTPFTLGFDGPLSVATNLRGSKLYLDIYENRDYVEKLLNFITEGVIKRNVALRKLFNIPEPEDGAGAGLADDSIQLISISMYEDLVMKYHTRWYDFWSRGGKNSIHLCGDAQRHFKVIKDNLNVSSFDTGFPIDFKKLREELGDEVEISGGPSVEILLNGNPDKVYQTTRDILTSGIMKGKRFVLREGNNLPPNVPAENLESMYTAALRFGRYRD